ncbi:MAG: hypothetical protein HGA45_18160, partial [Chloroflexales bacterium]|nr:hypothetical protein [Chloroflexales bacterium]
TATNLKRNFTITLATVMTVAVSLALVGASLMAQQGVERATKRWQGGIELLTMMLDFMRRLLPNLAGQSRLITPLSWGLYAFGSPRGALGVWVEGRRGERAVRRILALVAPRDGPIVAAAPAVLLARRLLGDDPPPPGATSCLDLVGFDELASFLAGFGIRAVWGDERGWRE